MQANSLYSLPIVPWEDDSNSSYCRRCLKEWSFLFRSRHHCRYCGELVCHECSPYKIAYAHFPHPVRSCCSCNTVVIVLIEEDKLYDDFHETKATVAVQVQRENRSQTEEYKEEITEFNSLEHTHHTVTDRMEAESDGDESVFALKDPNTLRYDASHPDTTTTGAVVLVEMGSPEHTPSRPVSHNHKKFSSRSVADSNSPNAQQQERQEEKEGSQKRLVRHLSSFQKISFENDDSDATATDKSGV